MISGSRGWADTSALKIPLQFSVLQAVRDPETRDI